MAVHRYSPYNIITRKQLVTDVSYIQGGKTANVDFQLTLILSDIFNFVHTIQLTIPLPAARQLTSISS